MTTATKRKKLHDFVNAADDKQLDVIYTFVEHEIGDDYEHWADEDFVKEIDKRLQDFESGKTKGLSWEEVKTKSKLKLMQEASTDPLFLADMNEIMNDFDHVDGENL